MVTEDKDVREGRWCRACKSIMSKTHIVKREDLRNKIKSLEEIEWLKGRSKAR